MASDIDGQTTVYGILGCPVAHSLSPLIHNTLAEATGLNMVYIPLGVGDSGRIGDAVRGACAMGIRGMNVTVPYKSSVISYLKEIDPIAEAIGAVNTLVPVHGSVRNDSGCGGSVPGDQSCRRDTFGGSDSPVPYRGYNTDYLGLRRALGEMLRDNMHTELGSMDVVLIGAGGAARAAGFMAAKAGVQHLTILNRTVSRAEALARDISGPFPDIRTRAMPLVRAADSVSDGWNSRPVVAIQCTNVGLAPHTADIPIEDPDFYRGIAAGFDCIYNPGETRFLAAVRRYGRPGQNGMDMLLYQGIESFTLWTGIQPDRDLIGKVRGRLEIAIHGA